MSESIGAVLGVASAVAPFIDPTGISILIFSIVTLMLSLAEHPHQPDSHRQTAFRIHLGLDSCPGQNLGGDIPDVRVWDERGNFLGRFLGDDEDVPAGDFFDFTIDLEKPHQPTYALFSANENDVCIAYITQTLATGERYSWTGQWARTCSKPWYYSGVVFDGYDDLACTWISLHHIDDKSVSGIQLHIHEFKYTESNNKSIDYFCAGNPTMKFYTESDPTEIDRWETRRPEDLNSTRGIVHVPGQPQDDRRRSVRPSDRSCPRSLHASRLIKSRRGQSASMLCADPASRGPDFVSYSEGLYCNMETREVLPLCDGAAGRVTGCFDDGGNIVKRSEVERGDVLDELGYDRVDEWL
ncbi:hypothetical protein M0657_001589 [Pyricularia oryzae]|uniref:Uncharacterized protein n=3 Tax=Pyricularia oryzae TaxID=318829 RepID=Q2KGG3_PYRO7|nr:hypothetical protein MGCH7_ch7g372 [Pyricularia oryzae 70-15]ELQ36304.1 hypothetical protein OOU_Y34scaffold00666g165 [Pyricularia oryzae Y34]KAI7929976.1 hypothetical protein M9X92_001094 [Pyricularia oryzae]KAI7930469.1 hypothetical protein M0657_001589 [Pyricularia oryzae]